MELFPQLSSRQLAKFVNKLVQRKKDTRLQKLSNIKFGTKGKSEDEKGYGMLAVTND